MRPSLPYLRCGGLWLVTGCSAVVVRYMRRRPLWGEISLAEPVRPELSHSADFRRRKFIFESYHSSASVDNCISSISQCEERVALVVAKAEADQEAEERGEVHNGAEAIL